MRRLGRKATREQTRAYNSRLVLKTIYDEGQISRADVARATGLTRATVSDVVADLMAQGLVERDRPGQRRIPRCGGQSAGRHPTPAQSATAWPGWRRRAGAGL